MFREFEINKLYLAKTLITEEVAHSFNGKPRVYEKYSLLYKIDDKYIDLFDNCTYPNSFYVLNYNEHNDNDFFQYTIEYIEPLTNYYNGNKKTLNKKQAINLANEYISIFEQKRLLSILMNYESIFLEDDKNVEVYKFSNVAKLNNVYPKRKAYILFNINEKNVLMEITEEYIRRTGLDFYVLSNDMLEDEKRIYIDEQIEIECDYIYSCRGTELTKENIHQKIIKR